MAQTSAATSIRRSGFKYLLGDHTPIVKEMKGGIYMECTWSFINENEEVIHGPTSRACWSSIVNGSIPNKTKIIDVQKLWVLIPYDVKSVKLYIKLLNEMGFPCKYKATKDASLHVHVFTKDYTTKEHIGSTLYLLRLIWDNKTVLHPVFKAIKTSDKPLLETFLNATHGKVTMHSGLFTGYAYKHSEKILKVLKATQNPVFSGRIAEIYTAWHKGI